MSQIIDALKDENVRLSNGNRWLVWDENSDVWVVYGKEYRQRGTETIYRGECENLAVYFLLYQDQDEV